MIAFRLFLGVLLPCCFLVTVKAQTPTITTISSRWQDSFVEWEIFAALKQPDLEEGEELEEETYGELKLRWKSPL